MLNIRRFPQFLPQFSTCAALLGVWCLGAYRAEAAPFVSAQEGYSINFPAPPQAGSRVMATPSMGQINVNFMAVSKPPLSFIVLPMRFPKAMTGASAERFLNSAQSSLSGSPQTRTLLVKKISLNGVPGREIVVQARQKLIRARFFIKGKRAYQVIAVSPQAGAAKYAPQITQVLDSFRITN